MTMPNPPATIMNKPCNMVMSRTSSKDLKMIQAMKKYMSQMKNVWAMKRPFCFIRRMLFSPFHTPAKKSAIL